MIFILTCIGIALFVSVVFALVLKTISAPELLVILGTQAVIAIFAAAICYWSSTSDTQVINSSVSDKKKVKVSCEHSYSCNCRQSCSGSGKNRSCHQVCDTCYEHSHDWDWRVFTAMGETFNISRIDRQGNKEPKRWTDVVIGDPTAVTRSYQNYVKAAPDTLFRNQGQLENVKVPEYPIDIYDYYNLNRLVQVGSNLPDTDRWNNQLSELNAELGWKKQVNIIVVATKNKSPDWFYALRQAWIGGRKNDVILVVNVDDSLKPVWANVMAWELNELFNVRLRDAVMAQPTLDTDTTISNLRTTIFELHKRKPMADFEYLKSSITPTTTQWIVSLFIQLLVLAGLLYFFHTEDPFDSRIRAHARFY